MCPHCLTSLKTCVHCAPDRPLRPPTVASIANFQAAASERGLTRSSLTNADRARLGIFPKPWHGVAANRPRPISKNTRTARKPAVILNNAFAGLQLPP